MEADLIIKGGKVVFPSEGVFEVDLGVKDGKIGYIGKDLHFSSNDEVINAKNLYVLPGIIDSHTHIGIHERIPIDARTETSAAVSGGITSVLNYYRAGRNNMEVEKDASRVPPSYLKVFPEVLNDSENNFFTDYGYHLAPVTNQHIEEIPRLVSDFGVTTFKFYMHYRGFKPEDNFDPNSLKEHEEYLFTDDSYDLGFLYKIMRKVSEVKAKGQTVRVNVHAENPSLIRVTKELTKHLAKSIEMTPLETYNSAKPPSVERVGIMEATEIAGETDAPLTILHISSEKAVSAVKDALSIHKGLDLGVETTLHHLTLSTDNFKDSLGKVNPPIRPHNDVDALWEGVRSGIIYTIATDSAGSRKKLKPDDVWKARPGFGGFEVFLPAILTEGYFKRKIPLEILVAKLTKNPAKLHGIGKSKGDIRVGADADLVLCDLNEELTVPEKNKYSAQDFNLFAGCKLRGFPVTTILRGQTVYANGEVVGNPHGKYLKRPC